MRRLVIPALTAVIFGIGATAGVAQVPVGQPEQFYSSGTCPNAQAQAIYQRQRGYNSKLPSQQQSTANRELNQWWSNEEAYCAQQRAQQQKPETRGLDQRQQQTLNRRYGEINRSAGVRMGNAYARSVGIPQYQAGPPNPNAQSLSEPTLPRDTSHYSPGYYRVPPGTYSQPRQPGTYGQQSARRFGGYNHAQPGSYAQRQSGSRFGGYKHVPPGTYMKRQGQAPGPEPK
jgi:hypothetical protein